MFEDLDRIKRRRFSGTLVANRKMSRFSKRELLEHAVIMALKYGFKVYLVDPSYTSVVGGCLSRELGLDKLVASAYMLTAKYLGLDLKSLKQPKQPENQKLNKIQTVLRLVCTSLRDYLHYPAEGLW